MKARRLAQAMLFLTTLSTLSIAGCKEGQLALMRGPAEGKEPPADDTSGTDSPTEGPVKISKATTLIGAAVAVVEWEGMANAASYSVVVAKDESCTTVVKSYTGITGTKTQLNGLNDGSYYVCISALNAAGNVISEKAAGMPLTLDKTPPGDFSISDPAKSTPNKSPEVKWAAAADAVSYELVISHDADCKNVVKKQSKVLSVKSVVGPLAVGSYHICVTAVDAAGNKKAATNQGHELVIRKREMLYLANNNAASVISQYEVDPDTGALTHVTDESTGEETYPNSVVAGAGNKFLFAPLMVTNEVAVLQINQETGVASLSGTYATPTKPRWIAAHPTLNVIYVACNTANTVAAFRFDETTGALTGMTELPAGTAPRGINVTPDGRQVLVASNWSGSAMSFSIDPTTGDISGGSTQSGLGDTLFAIADNTSGHIYAADSMLGIWHLTFDSSSGVFTAPSVPSYATPTGPMFLTIDPTNTFLYAVADWAGGEIHGFRRNLSDGALTSIGTFDISPTPGQAAFSGAGKFLYVASSSDELITTLSVDQTTGALTSIGTTATQAGGTGLQILQLP